MNKYITPNEFSALVFYEDEHPIAFREEETGMRNVIVYHTAGPNPTPIAEQTEISSDIWTFQIITQPEEPTWDNIY